MRFNTWLESRPQIGIVASLSGFTASLLALFQDLSIILGFLGAIFGFVAGYYTWRVKREHWKRVQRVLAPAKKTRADSNAHSDKVHGLAILAATKAYDEAVKSSNSPIIL